MASPQAGWSVSWKDLPDSDRVRSDRYQSRLNPLPQLRLGFQLPVLDAVRGGGFVAETAVADAVSGQYGVPTIELNDFEVDPEVIALIPEDVANKHLILPVNRAGSTLIIAMSDPSNIFAIDDVKFLTGYNVDVGESEFDEERFFKLLKSLKGRFLITYGIRGKFPDLVKGSDFWSKRIRTRRSIAHMRGVGDALLATLAYRLFSFWLPIPAGAVAYLVHRRWLRVGPDEPEPAQRRV